MDTAPADAYVRIQCNLPGVETAEEALRLCLPLVAELSPREVQFEAAHPHSLRTGFLVGLLTVLPPAPATPADQEAALRAATDGLITRLGLDPAALHVDAQTPHAGTLNADEADWAAGRTAYGTYSLCARLGADPFHAPEDGDEYEVEDLVAEGPVEPLDDPESLAALARDLSGVHVSLTARAAGVSPDAAVRLTEELGERIGALALGSHGGIQLQQEPDHAGDGSSAVGALLGPVDVAAPEVLAAVSEALEAEGWQRVQGPAGPLLSTLWQPGVASGTGLTGLDLHVAEGWTLFLAAADGQ
ncbi:MULTISPECIES: hypothetical protein [unclassified Streptomyces]|uniref:hypothetical protein n=1 Tax=unclassified Streptomyces TaxID=2593676 RepID=UPI002E2B393D|nr:hypothetical protein [Streptomyces sp. NBC_01439]